MTETIINSATKEVVFGFEQPFVSIGECIGPAGRKLLTARMVAGDCSRVEINAIAPLEAGAHMLDVNVGISLRNFFWPLASEKLMMIGSNPQVSVGEQCHE